MFSTILARDFFNAQIALGSSAVQNSHLQPHSQFKTNGSVVAIELDLPGVKKEDVQVDLNSNKLHIVAKRKRFKKFVENEDQKNLQEIIFEKKYELSETIDKKNIQAKLEDGVLYIELAKVPEQEPTKILIE